MDEIKPTSSFACILAFCASLFGGAPADEGMEYAPPPHSMEQVLEGTWTNEAREDCSIHLSFQIGHDGYLEFDLKSSEADYGGLANLSYPSIFLGDVTSALYDSESKAIILNNEPRDERPVPFPECLPERLIPLKKE